MLAALVIIAVIALAHYRFTQKIGATLALILKALLVLILGAIIGGSFLAILAAWAGVHAIYTAYTNQKNGKEPFNDSESVLGKLLSDAIGYDVGRYVFWAEIALFVLITIL